MTHCHPRELYVIYGNNCTMICYDGFYYLHTNQIDHLQQHKNNLGDVLSKQANNPQQPFCLK